ncbi:MAG: hypothetical protein ACYCPQ_00550 [Elusimicrobiota bacterium]
MTPIERLKAICDEVVRDPALAPRPDGTTYCNLAVQRVSKAMGCEAFAGLMANQIFELCLQSEDWEEADAETASAAANQGVLCLAAQRGDPHGHVAALYPAPMVWSQKWGKQAPTLANVGEHNGVMGANWAFAQEPTYFIFQGEADDTSDPDQNV